MTSSADLTFVHLSDIHFRKDRVGTAHDSDEELRDGLTSDLRRLVPRFGPISGIILTGDIAWGGHPREYQYAESWIRQIAEHLQCSLSNVMVTPGNHDVSWPELKKHDDRITKLQRKIRTGGQPDITVERLTSALSGTNRRFLTAPLRAYNKFAKRFSCDISAAHPYWERPFTLGDGATLLIRGITSTWLSGPSDNERTPRLLYGSGQYSFRQAEGTYYLVVGHHPPGNMIDGENAAKAFDFYCKLQLFGHRHSLWITRMVTSTRIVAGALHPDRRERFWVPRYNILEISGELTPTARLFSIKVYPRRWSDEFRQFMADFTPDAKDVRLFEYFASVGPPREGLNARTIC